MKRILDYINVVPFQELDIKELEAKGRKVQEVERCRQLRDYLYEDFREGSFLKRIIRNYMKDTRKKGKKRKKQSGTLNTR